MRWIVIGGVLVIAAAGAGSAALGLWNGSAPPPRPKSALPTAEVARKDLADRTEADGTLGYTGSYDVTAGSKGRITRLPKAGDVIKRGESVFSVNGTRVPLFYGRAPLWRNLSQGVAKGPDIKAVKRNLKALGYDVTANEYFDWTLRSALKEWQDDRGVTATGTIAPGDVVVLPAAIRVTKVRTSPGLPASGIVLKATGTTRQVKVDIPVTHQHLVREKSKVTIRLPGGKTTSGHVASVGSVAAAASSNQTGEGTETATVAVRITLDRPRAAGRLDGAPVTVGFAGKTRKNVLSVPVAALVATPGGGYRVRIDDGGRLRDVPVELGIFSDGDVEVEGDLTAGMKVQVPRA